MSEILTQGPVTAKAFDDTDNFVIQHSQDVEPILNHVARLNQITDGKSKTGEFYHAAELPQVVILEWCKRKGITFQEWMQNPNHVKAMLRDPDLAYFRVWKGKV